MRNRERRERGEEEQRVSTKRPRELRLERKGKKERTIFIVQEDLRETEYCFWIVPSGFIMRRKHRKLQEQRLVSRLVHIHIILSWIGFIMRRKHRKLQGQRLVS